jgi:rhodanese-related sulfurtransferase
MKKYLMFFLLFACTEKNTDNVLTVQEFDKKFKATDGAILLDVRRPEEIANGKIEGSVNIVWDDAFADKLSNLDHKPIFVYCASGIRSAKAAAILREKGYIPVIELDGGFGAWRDAGMPVN